MLYITTSLKAQKPLWDEAAAWAASIGAAYVPRQQRTIHSLCQQYGREKVLVYTSKGPVMEGDAGSHFFSLNMAELRILQIDRGQVDHFKEALGTWHRPVSFLDCTCGFGADTIIAAYTLPEGSTIHALEATEPLAAVTSWGFTHFTHRRDDVTKALRKVRLTWGNYTDYLSNEKSRTYDILYFDPMFTHPVMTSCQFAPIRSQMDHEPLTADSIQKALEKARRVIVKGRSFAELNRQFPQARIRGGRYSRVKFAVLEGT